MWEAGTAQPGGAGLAGLGCLRNPRKRVSGAGERAAGSEVDRGTGHTSLGVYRKLVRKQWKGVFSREHHIPVYISKWSLRPLCGELITSRGRGARDHSEDTWSHQVREAHDLARESRRGNETKGQAYNPQSRAVHQPESPAKSIAIG